MRYGNHRPAKRRFGIINSPVSVVGALILLVILARTTWNIRQKAILSDLKLSQAQTEYAKEQARQKSLQAQVSYLSTDQGIEAELRDKYRAVKEGESVAVIIDGQTDAVPATSTVGPTLKAESWWREMLSLFGL